MLQLFTHALHLNISSLPCVFPPRHSPAAADDGGPFDISELWGAASPDANPSASETTSVTTTTSSSAIVAAPPARRQQQQQQLRASSASVGVRATASASKPARGAPQQSLPRRSTDQSARSDEATSGRGGVFAAGATPYRRVSWRQDDPPASAAAAPRPRPASAPRPQRPASVSAAFGRGGQMKLDDRSGGFGGGASAAAASIAAAAAAPEALFPFKPELNPLSLRLAEASHPMLPGARIEQLAVPRSLVQAAKLDKVRMSNRATWAELHAWFPMGSPQFYISILGILTVLQHAPDITYAREYARSFYLYMPLLFRCVRSSRRRSCASAPSHLARAVGPSTVTYRSPVRLSRYTRGCMRQAPAGRKRGEWGEPERSEQVGTGVGPWVVRPRRS